MVGEVQRGRDAFDRQAWSGAYGHLCAADEHEPLEIDDLERLACAAYLTGRGEESSDVWARAHQESANVGDVTSAARSAFWLAFSLLNDGQIARGGGWIDRAQRLLDERNLECVEQGYLRYASALRAVFSGDGEVAYDGFRQAAGIGDRFQDPQLRTLARIGEGRCLIYAGQLEAGMALLDEAMVGLGQNEISVVAAGDSYCTAIAGCSEIFDVERMAEWTAALNRWCEAQPDLVLYRGQCLIHRAEIFQLVGAWDQALDEVARACARLADPPGQAALGAASYVRGDIHRLQGDLADAERAYLDAGRLGCDPQPGLALLRLAQGRSDLADSAIRRALVEADDPLRRARLLGPFVEITSSTGALDSAAEAAAELSGLAADLDKPYLRAVADHMTGLVELHEGTPGEALATLRDSWNAWRDLNAPYEAARTRIGISHACRELGDLDGAQMELSAASATLLELGADPEQADVASSRIGDAGATSEILTRRELEVIALLAQGHTNRAIARELVISEKTVASHVGHILTKLDVSTRTAAAAYAFAHDLT